MNNVKIKIEDGVCKEITINGENKLNCLKAELEIEAGCLPVLKLSYPIINADIETDDNKN